MNNPLLKTFNGIVGAVVLLFAGIAAAEDRRNILVIFGDDLGIYYL